QDAELWRALEAAAPAAAPPGAEVPAVVLNRDAVLAQVGGNVELLRRLTGVFHTDCAHLTAEIGAALERQDLAAVAGPAHTLKGMVGFFGPGPAVEAVVRLEALTKQGDL